MGASKEKQVFYSVVINGVVHDVTGRKKTPGGYITLCINSHPNRDKGSGYILEHRVIMEMFLGRYLSTNELVHHINEIKHDNRLSNLSITNRSEHAKMHHEGIKRSEATKKKISETLKIKANNQIDKEKLVALLKKHSITETAKILSVSRQTIHKRKKEFNL